jgi:hypothetical protein
VLIRQVKVSCRRGQWPLPTAFEVSAEQRCMVFGSQNGRLVCWDLRMLSSQAGGPRALGVTGMRILCVAQ